MSDYTADRGAAEALRAYTRDHGVPPTCATWRAGADDPAHR